ncbi:MAG: serine hydrolase domain-containing protein [Acidimicrobiales bacterium]
MRRSMVVVAVAMAVGALVLPGTAQASPFTADLILDRLLQRFVLVPGASPGIGVVVHRGSDLSLHTAGVADVTTRAPFRLDDHMRLASVAKAFSGAASQGLIPLNTTVGSLRPDLPAAWSAITLGQLLNHTSGIPDFSKTPAFVAALLASLLDPPPPRQLLSFIENDPLLFPPGSRYQYSNSDNIVVGLMVESFTGKPYEQVLAERVFGPFGLSETSLPRDQHVPDPKIHGYEVNPLEDVTELFAAGWTWASGGIVSTPRDADRFVRAYAAGFSSGPYIAGGSSEPPGPGTNSAGHAIFRYQTSCGTVYGHTGNTAGYTQFIASTPDGTRSTVVSVNAQLTPSSNLRVFTELRNIYQYAVCAALAR